MNNSFVTQKFMPMKLFPVRRRPSDRRSRCSLISATAAVIALVAPPAAHAQAQTPALNKSPGLEASPGANGAPLSLAQAVSMALRVNPTLVAAQEALVQAQGHTAEAGAAFNPTLSSTFTYTRLNQGQSAKFNGQTIVLANPDQPVLGLQATLPIDIVGELRAAKTQAEFQQISSRLDINRAQNDLVLSVKSAFYSLLRAEATVTVASENVRDNQLQLDDARKKLRAGTVAQFDVISAETNVANAQQQLISARSSVSLAVAALNSAIGLNIDTPLQVSADGAVLNPPTAATVTAPATSTGFDALDLGSDYRADLAQALNDRPEILEGDAALAAARKGILLAERSQLPSLGLSITANYNPNAAGFTPITTNGAFVAQLSMPIFEGGFAKARLKEARAGVAVAENALRVVTDQVTLDVRTAWLNVVQAAERVRVADAALKEARDQYRLARVRYNAGVAAQAGISPLLEVSNAQSALAQAEDNQVNALYDFNSARAALDHAAGRFAYLPAGAGFPAPPPPAAVGAAAPAK
ncbi:MAG: TolC family protein [Armatimonadetes bacterium]|nr:TolC family protein [Armatimonadota bacterium]MDE2207504.1 TolC family protein [Armatimonadota bacterium]